MKTFHLNWGGGYTKSEVDTLLNGKSDTSHTHTKSQITDFPSYGTTANTICEGNDSRLSDARTPTSHTHTKSEITDFPSLATVATSGSYNDLTNKPTIPTKVSDLTNDSGFLTSSGSCNYANSAGTASSATTSGAVSTSVPIGSTKDLVYAYMADNDAFRIRCGGDSDAGYVEIATSDNGNEPIYVRQYSLAGGNLGDFTTITRTLTLLDGSGNTQFPGTVTATTFTGNLTGNCSGSAGSVAWSNVSDKPTIPTKTSDLTNDSGFLTSHQDLSGYVPRGGGAVMGRVFSRQVNDSELRFDGGTGLNNGASFSLSGKDSTNAGAVAIVCHDGTDYKKMFMNPSGTWTWSGTACQITSDQRLKQQIAEIDDKLLDAWSDVDLVQFKYNDAVNEKGDKARLHTGFVVQQIDDACKKHGMDISAYGLYCHEVYPEETEEVEIEQADGTKTKEKKVIRETSEHYSLRYTEALIVECKYLRRENARLKQQMQQYSESLNKLEERLKALEQSSK